MRAAWVTVSVSLFSLACYGVGVWHGWVFAHRRLTGSYFGRSHSSDGLGGDHEQG